MDQMFSNLSEIQRLAAKMRKEIESIPPAQRPISFEAFPKGSCSDASLLLGAYLKDRAYGDFALVSGERGYFEDDSWTSHAWLAQRRLIVDITADQFEDAGEGVIVATDSVWHKTFKIKEKGPGDFRNWSGPSVHKLGAFYQKLKTELS